MDSKKFKKIDSIYEVLSELPVREHEAYLNKVCGDDAELRAEIESLLEFDSINDSLIDSNPDFLAAEIFSEREDMSGERLGRYRILSLLGRGGMGTVYLAKDTRLNRKIAVKFLRREFSSDADKLKRFVQEAKSASALNHPNIITVYEIDNKNGIDYIAAEFIEGVTLRELIAREKSLTLNKILKTAIQIAEALAQAHRAGIIHRDIKPENIMLRPDGYVKILDFGLAKLFETETSELENLSRGFSTPGLIKGTVAYMSPEQARGVNIDKRSDIWSFGVLLYEVLSGRVPFAGETLTDVLVSIINKEPRSLSFYRPNLPEKLLNLIERTLQKNPEKRVQDFEIIVNELKFIKRNLTDGGRNHLKTSGSTDQTKLFFDEETVVFDSNAVNREVASGNFGEHNLSSEINPLIGRLSEISEIANLLEKPKTRLVTLTGIGGTGKTRLARAAAANLIKKFQDGIYFVDLSTVEDSELVIPFIAKTLGLVTHGEESISTILKDFLKTKNTLLILDNFEQVVRAAPSVGGLISETENLKILVTSRVRLHLSFEKEITIEPLGFPADSNLNAEQFGEYPAVSLFVERARAIKPNFALTEKNAGAIAEICKRLDGIPLAIELAAARVKLLAPRAILKRLDKSLKLLTGGAKDLPERQQTMRQTIGWSYDLLEPDEQKLLDRVSVFRGGFDIEAAEAIGIFDEDLDILDGLASLVDKSLIFQKQQEDGEPRFRLLIVVREFAREKLNESKEIFRAKKRHIGFFLELAAEAAEELEKGDEAQWLDKIEIEMDNFRAALERALEIDPEAALKIAVSLSRFWIVRSYFSEGCRWIAEALAQDGGNSDLKLRAKALMALSSLSWRLGNYEKAEFYSKEGLRCSREVGDKLLISLALEGAGNVMLMTKNLERAKEFYEEQYKIVKELNDKSEIASAANGLGHVLSLRKDDAAAHKYYEESLSMARESSHKSMIQIASINLASNVQRLGDNESARSYAAKSLEIAVEMGDKIGIGYALEVFSVLAVTAGEFKKAINLNEAMTAIYEKADYEMESYEREYVESYTEKARAALSEEELEKAESAGRKLSVEEAIDLALG